MKKELYKLTQPQMSIYMSEQFTKKPINNIGAVAYFDKSIDIERLKEAVNLTIKNNDAIRTIIVMQGGEPMQYFDDFKTFNINVYNYSNKSKEEFKKFQDSFIQKSFDIYGNYLFDFNICILDDEIALNTNFHHLIADAWTMGLLIDSIAVNYTALEKG